MRNISFSMTTPQFRARTKTVTRRMGWAKLGPGDELMACRKCMGLKAGEKVERLGKIRVVSVRRERLDDMTTKPIYGQRECAREGFPDWTPMAFVEFFCQSHACKPDSIVTRIEYEYLPLSPQHPDPRAGQEDT